MDLRKVISKMQINKDIVSITVILLFGVSRKIYNFRDPVLLLITPKVAIFTSFKKLEELCMVLPPNIILTCGLIVFRLYSAIDSSYVTPPITKTIISCVLLNT